MDPSHQYRAATQIRASELFIFILKEKKQQQQKKTVQNPIFQCQPCPPPTPRSVPLAQGWTLSSRSAPSPLSCNPLGAGGSTSLGCYIPAGLGGRGGKNWRGQPLVRLPPPGLQPWHQVPLLALINPFLIILLAQGVLIWGNPVHTPLCPGAGSGLSSLRLGGSSRPPSLRGGGER